MNAVAATPAAPRVSQGRAVFLAQVILQPLFLLFVFGKVLSALATRAPATRSSCSRVCSR
jgi:hypothetical protein